MKERRRFSRNILPQRAMFFGLNGWADCIITACAMCHLNLEVRCSLKEKVPVMHFSEILSLALGVAKTEYKGWFSRHLVDPKPFLKALDLF